MPAHQTLLSLNAGEISPYLWHRVDFEKHASGAAELTNFLPLPYGGIRKRPGTLTLAAIANAAPTRLLPFAYDSTTRYILAFQSGRVYIFGPDGTLKDTEVHTFGDPFKLQFVHANDVLFVASPNIHPKQVTRVADTNWTVADVAWTYPPLLDENADESLTIAVAFSSSPAAWSGSSVSYTATTSVTNGGVVYTCIDDHTSAAGNEPGTGADAHLYWVKGYATATTSVDLTASASLFTASHVGACFKVSHERRLDEFDVSINLLSTTDGDKTPTLVVTGKWSVRSAGIWGGTVYVERSTDGGATWEDFRSYTSSGDRNFNEEVDEGTALVLVRLRWDYVSSPSGTLASDPSATLEAGSRTLDGLVEIDTYTSGTSVAATVTLPVQITTTDRWTECAFSAARGYPCAIAVHERRLAFAGTDHKPVSLWLSATDDLLNFTQGTDDDDSLFVTLASTSQDKIRWLASQRRLMFGTAVGEWVVGSETSDAPLTPTNFLAREYTNYGSAELPAFRHHDGVYFMQRQARRLRELGYDLARETYDAADLSRLAEHITAGGLVQVDFQTGREPFIWAVRGDGALLSFAYVRSERIAAWSRHTLAGGLVKSVAVLGSDSDDDDVFLIVLRGSTYYLEKLAAGQQALQEDGDLVNCHHLDAAVAGTTDGSGVLDGLDHLEGQTITYMADGVPGTANVAAGEISTGKPSATCIAGLPVTSTLVTLPLDTMTQSGPTLGRRKRASRLQVSYYQARGGTWSYQGTDSPIEFSLSSDPLDDTPPLFTGWKETILGPGYADDVQFTLTHAAPYPFTIRAISIFWDVTEP